MSYLQQAALDRIKRATCQIVYGDESGTGYLIAGNRIVTCWHVVKDVPSGHPAAVLFPGQKSSSAFVTDRFDPRLDVAILEWRKPIPGIEPLQFGHAEDRKTLWEGFGYPSLSQSQGLVIDGTLDDLSSKDQQSVDSLLVKSDKLLAPAGDPHGFSGTPILQHGLVVGHLKEIIPDPQAGNRAGYGVAYAARSEDFIALIGEALQTAQLVTAQPLPPRPAYGYDVFLSASGDGVQQAQALALALRARNLRVHFPLVESVAGTPVSTESMLTQSRAAVLLITPNWHLRQEESETLWQHRQRVPVIPVLPNGGSLPSPWNGALSIDLKGGGASGPAFERLVCAINGQSAPFEIVEQDIKRASQRDDVAEPSLKMARELIGRGDPGRALTFLPKFATDLETRGLRALTLSKTGRTQEAIDSLEIMRDRGELDGERSGILGGCYRRLYDRTKQKSALIKALKAYSAGFSHDTNTYAGINQASILLELGQVDEARQIAKAVKEQGEKKEESERKEQSERPAAVRHWTPATIGEALLILNEVEAATGAYERAVRLARHLPQDRAVMRRGARRALVGNGRPERELDEIFGVPRPIAFVGHGFDFPNQPLRFPERAAADVERAIDAVLATAPAFGISSATVGGDTIFLDRMFRHENAVRILLPRLEERFLAEFVVLSERIFEVRRLLKDEHADVEVVEDPTDRSDFWSDFAPRLRQIGEALETALDEKPLLLALWNRQRSFLESVINQWERKGWPIEILRLENGTFVSREPFVRQLESFER